MKIHWLFIIYEELLVKQIAGFVHLNSNPDNENTLLNSSQQQKKGKKN
jgi:hypothetical protein